MAKIFEQNNAFTLAEVLITLAIIGVVAAMTIPNLLKNTNDTELKTAWKKTFSTFSQASEKIMAENGGNMVGYSSYSANVSRDTFLNYMQYIKKCDIGTIYGNCWHQTGVITWLNGQKDSTIEHDSFWDFAHTSGAVMNDGAYVLFSQVDAECDYGGNGGVCSEMTIDVNGAKAPNVVGRDIFQLFVTSYTVKPFGYWYTSAELDTYCNRNNTGNYACSAQYLTK